MLRGTFLHSVDDKGRVIMPSKFREDFKDNCIITMGLDNCLYVYAPGEWAQLEAKIQSFPFHEARRLQRFFIAGASDAVTDKQGRLLIPPYLREYAMLQRDVAIIGVSDRAEIWDAKRWKDNSEGLTSDVIELAMKELGF